MTLPTVALAFLVAMSASCGPGDSPEPSGGDATRAPDGARLFGEIPSTASGGEAAPDTTPEGDAPVRGRTVSVDLTELGFTRGDPDAPIRVIEFSDFGCGYCRKFHLETFPTVAEEYIDTGKVVWKYIPFVLGIFPNAVEAATAGECAGEQSAFGPMRDRLFRDQPEWRKASDPFELFHRYAREEGLDSDRFRACVTEGWMGDRVRRNIRAGHQIGIRGTPTFVVNGFPVQGAVPASVFRDIFRSLLEEESGGGAG